ncbi:hypothetical protein ACFOMD_03665 [Sphingoaurantiacus capsulatus]|uniref:DUF2125 domain-containing protein n=1 Tax=Sphingoaurantiacus capsulatus TaxID=1771310 RepID=A0ABV7X975_9SPHN
MSRIPLWATLIPLAVGLGAYWWYWDGERAIFEQALTGVLAEPAAVGGFPYRLEAGLPSVRFRHDGQYRFSVEAETGQLNRQPWKQDLTSIGLLKPKVVWSAPGLDGAVFQVESAEGHASLRLDGTRIARLSAVHNDARVTLPLLRATATAPSFEWHFRETPATADPASRAPTFPEQAQVVLVADAIRFGGGDPLNLSAQLGVTSAAPVWDFAGWRQGGTVELRSLTLSDGHGDILNASATGVAGSADPLRVSGTIRTVCPLTVQAALAGTPAPAREYRTRKEVSFAFGGIGRDVQALLPPEGLPKLPLRQQEPPCPKIVG